MERRLAILAMESVSLVISSENSSPAIASLLLITLVSGPAVAAGNTIVVKASEKSPLQSILFGKFVMAAGFPPGVINIVSGAGKTGALLASHMQIRKISFTGSTAAGRKVQQAAAASNLKVVTLELGGKSPSIVFDDADIAKSAETVVMSSLINMGQVCTVSRTVVRYICYVRSCSCSCYKANTRIYVQDTIAPVFLEHLKQHFAGWTAKQGDPSDPNTLIGTVADAAQVKHVTGLIESGTAEGGKIAIGGKGQGAFILPTIFTDVQDDATINVNEVFGPVMVYHTFRTEEEVLKRANASDYALYASVSCFSCAGSLHLQYSQYLLTGLYTGHQPCAPCRQEPRVRHGRHQRRVPDSPLRHTFWWMEAVWIWERDGKGLGCRLDSNKVHLHQDRMICVLFSS